MASFATRLNEALDRNRMTAAELSRKTGISRGSISQYLAGTVTPKADKIIAISQALNVSPAWLMAVNYPTQEELAEEVKAVFNSLPADLQTQAVTYLHFLASSYKATKSEESPDSP
jgi:repressor LexA